MTNLKIKEKWTTFIEIFLNDLNVLQIFTYWTQSESSHIYI